MNTMNKTIVGLLAVALLLSGYASLRPAKVETIKEVQVGAVSSPDVFSHMRLNSGFTVGGSFATSSAGSFTWESKELRDYNTVTITPGAALTATMPASTTLDSMLPNKGDTRSVFIKNGSGTAGRNITLAGATGTILRGVNGTSTVIYAGRGAVLQFYRSATSSPLGDVYVTVIPE